MEYEKQYAVFSSVNQPDETDPAAKQTENLIHESGRLHLNTYQASVRNLMNPKSDLRSLMLVHMTGTGKTITALATATEYVRRYTKGIFKKELLSHPEFEFVNMDDAKDLKSLENQMHDSPVVAEQYHVKRKRYQRRLFKREVKAIYQFYGYKQFSNRIINMSDVQTMIGKQSNNELDVVDFDPKIIKKWIDAGKVRININFIRSLSHSLFICDEVHNLYKTDSLNTYGLAIEIVFGYFFNTLQSNDINYGSIRSLMLSATPLTTSALEIIPIVKLLTGETLQQSNLFKITDGVDQLTNIGSNTIRKAIAGKISYIMDGNPKEYPTSSFAGEKIKNIDYIRFIRSIPIDHQLECFKQWKHRANTVDERGNNMIKDIAFPSIKEYPHGVVFSKNVSDLADLPESIAVSKSLDGWTTSNIFKLKELKKYSCKYATLTKMCLDMKDIKHGKMFIYHPFVQGSGTDLIVSILHANEFVMDGDTIAKDSICMHCGIQYGSHKNIKDHEFNPVRFIFITGSLNKSIVSARLNAYNSNQNTYGERVKIIIGSRAMRESHTLKACRHVVITHEPSSISEMVQIIGRAVRKHVHSALPQDMRSVQIHILSTNVDSIHALKNDTSSNEELAYKIKVLQYGQINRIDRIMYDVSIDYLINFRFKLRETPPLLGEPYSLDEKTYNQYEKTLTKAYSNLRNGITPHGIHSNRFNVFYFEGEVRTVMMIIKKIILDYQLVVSIGQLKELVRAPPFHVEYNTNLISDESIAVAVSNLSFKFDQLRLNIPANTLTTVDTLFDQSSTLIDSSGTEYRIVCIGDPLCLDSYLTKRTISSIIEGDKSVIDSFRRVYSDQFDKPIDLQDLSAKWASTIDINDVLEDIKGDWVAGSSVNKDIDNQLQRLPNESHCLVAEWVIKYAVGIAFKTKKPKHKDLELVQYLINFYQSKRLMFTISDLKSTRIYDRYKPFDTNTGTSWFSEAAKVSTGTSPIGHSIGDSIRVYNLIDMTWLELSSIGKGIDEKHPYGFYIYEERIGKTLEVSLKIKFDKDKKAKGITMVFLQTNEIEKIAKQLKLNISMLKYKSEMIEHIEKAAWALQLKMYPKRIIYRLIDFN